MISDLWQKVCKNMAAALADSAGVGTLLLTAVLLLLFDRYGWQEPFLRVAATLPAAAGLSADRLNLFAQAYYSAACLLGYILIPALFNWLWPVPGVRLGLRGGDARGALPFCLVTIVAAVPCALLLARSSHMAGYYPLYRPDSIAGWLIHESLYSVQIFAVEFFFRGFLLFRLEPSFNRAAVAVTVVPYAFIHIHKPLLEAVGSIPVGLFLGVLALNTRSIAPGFLMHFAIALAADLASMLPL